MEKVSRGEAKVMSGEVKIGESEVRLHLGEFVRSTVEETLNAMLDAEADELCGAGKYERSPGRVNSRAGKYGRRLVTGAGPVDLKVPKLRNLPFETQIIERYRRKESSVEEALVEMYLAGVSVRRVEDITEALWGMKVSASAVSSMNAKIYGKIEEWRNRPIEGEHPYLYLDGIWLNRSWGGTVEKVAVLVAIGVSSDGFREIIGVCEGGREDKDSWRSFLGHLCGRGLKGVRLVVSDKCLGLLEAMGDFLPDAKWQRCMVHWYRNVFSLVPRGKRYEVSKLLKAIHAQEDHGSACEKAEKVASKLREMRLEKAAELVSSSAEETLRYMFFPQEHWTRIRTNNPLERIMREIRRRTRVVGSFPDGKSALMLVAARLRHIAGTKWGDRKYLDMGRLRDAELVA